MSNEYTKILHPQQRSTENGVEIYTFVPEETETFVFKNGQVINQKDLKMDLKGDKILLEKDMKDMKLDDKKDLCLDEKKDMKKKGLEKDKEILEKELEEVKEEEKEKHLMEQEKLKEEEMLKEKEMLKENENKNEVVGGSKKKNKKKNKKNKQNQEQQNLKSIHVEPAAGKDQFFTSMQKFIHPENK